MIAQDLKAYVVEPEHRFYGESLPFGESSLDPELMKGYFNPQQALADAANFLQHMRKQLGCSETGNCRKEFSNVKHKNHTLLPCQILSNTVLLLQSVGHILDFSVQ